MSLLSFYKNIESGKSKSVLVLFGLVLGISVGGNLFLVSKFFTTQLHLNEYREANSRVLQTFDFYGSIRSISLETERIIVATDFFARADAVFIQTKGDTFFSEQTADSRNQIVSNLDDRTIRFEEFQVGDKVRVLARDTGREIVALWIRKIE